MKKTLKGRLTVSMASRRHLELPAPPSPSPHDWMIGTTGSSSGHSSVGKRPFEASDEEEQINDLPSLLPAVAWWWLRPAVPTGGGLCHSGLAESAHGQGMVCAWALCLLGTSRPLCVGEIPVAHILWGEVSDSPVLGNPEEIDSPWISIWILHVGGFGFCCVVQLSSGC